MVPLTEFRDSGDCSKNKYGMGMTNSPRSDVLAPAGPAWAGSLMGTSIFATLAHIHDVPVVPELLLVVAVGILGFHSGRLVAISKPGFSLEVAGAVGHVRDGHYVSRERRKLVV